MNGLLRATSLRAGSYDKLRSERDLRFYRIRDEALCLNALHDFAGAPKLSCAIKGYTRSNGDFRDAVLAFDVFEQAFGLALISHRNQAFRLGEREERQHQARINRAHE